MQIDARRRVRRLFSSWYPLFNFLLNIPTYVRIHIIQNVEVVFSFLLLIQLKQQGWYPHHRNIIVCRPQNKIARMKPHVEAAAITRRFTTADVFLTAHETVLVEKEMFHEKDFGMDPTVEVVICQVLGECEWNVEQPQPR